MARFVPAEQTGFARHLRREMTTAETSVWRALRAGRLGGAKFRRPMKASSNGSMIELGTNGYTRKAFT